MPSKAWAYYSSAADDEITNRENHAAYQRQVVRSVDRASLLSFGSRIWFRPKILIDVTKVDFSTFILGQKTSMPIYIVRGSSAVCNAFVPHDCMKTATALGKLGHPDGELNLTRAAARYGILQMVVGSMLEKKATLICVLDTNAIILFFR